MGGGGVCKDDYLFSLSCLDTCDVQYIDSVDLIAGFELNFQCSRKRNSCVREGSACRLQAAGVLRPRVSDRNSALLEKFPKKSRNQ